MITNGDHGFSIQMAVLIPINFSCIKCEIAVNGILRGFIYYFFMLPLSKINISKLRKRCDGID